MKDHKAIFY